MRRTSLIALEDETDYGELSKANVLQEDISHTEEGVYATIPGMSEMPDNSMMSKFASTPCLSKPLPNPLPNHTPKNVKSNSNSNLNREQPIPSTLSSSSSSGGYAAPDESIYENNADLRAIQNEPWFHPAINREGAARMLDGTEIGTYLVRRNKEVKGNSTGYCLSVMGQDRVANLLIMKTDDNKLFFRGGIKKFKAMSELIDHYKHNSLICHRIVCKLKNYIPSK